MSFRMRLPLLLAAIAVLAIGCGGTDDPPTEGSDDTVATEEVADAQDVVDEEPTDETVGTTEEEAAVDGGASDDWCALLPTVEVEAFFAEQLELGEPRTLQTGGCTWPVVGAEGEGLMVANTSVGTFEALAAYEDGGGVETERLELGDEALLLNGADLAIRRGGEELRLALQAIFLSEEMGGEGAEAPDPDVVRQGLIDLAAMVLERT
jgi:hypothetical protein